MRVAHQIRSRPAANPAAPGNRNHERRAYVRARLTLPVWVCRIAGQASPAPPPLRIHDISSSGAFFLYPEKIDPGTPLSLEVSLIEERRRHRAVRMCVDAHVVRAEAAEKSGW